MKFYDELNLTKEELKNIISGKKFIVSISGMDNVGKSTQAKKMHEVYGNIFSEPLHINQTEAFPKLSGKELSNWWFGKKNAKDFVDTIYKALAQRYQIAHNRPEPIIIFDKGIDFYDTRVKATLLTEGFSQAEILLMISEAKAKYKAFNSMEDLKIVITAHNRNHIKEYDGSDESYGRYIGYNIEILNNRLNEDKNNEFKKVEFIDGGQQKMHEEIVAAIANTIRVKTQYPRYNEILQVAKNAFGDNLSLLTLSGSAGKGRFVEGWSDLDVYVILKDYNIDQAREFKKLLPKDIHIGTTFYTGKETHTGKLNNRSKVMFYEIGKGKNTILYKDENYIIPEININEILREDTSEYADTIHNLRRCLVDGSDANRTSVGGNDAVTTKIIKNVVLLQKIALRNSEVSKISGGYIDTSMAFIDLVAKAYANGFKIEKKYIETLTSVDLLDCVKKHNEPQTAKIMQEYGCAVLAAIGAVDDFNLNRRHNSLIQREEEKNF